jgi:hypothetical protein
MISPLPSALRRTRAAAVSSQLVSIPSKVREESLRAVAMVLSIASETLASKTLD